MEADSLSQAALAKLASHILEAAMLNSFVSKGVVTATMRPEGFQQPTTSPPPHQRAILHPSTQLHGAAANQASGLTYVIVYMVVGSTDGCNHPPLTMLHRLDPSLGPPTSSPNKGPKGPCMHGPHPPSTGTVGRAVAAPTVPTTCRTSQTDSCTCVWR